MTKLKCSTQDVASHPQWRYMLDMTQVHITTVRGAVLQSSPGNVHAQGEKTPPGWVVLKRLVHEPETTPGKGDVAGHLWVYGRNYKDGVFERVMAEDFQSPPAMTYGMEQTFPVIQVEVVTYQSSTPKNGDQVQELFLGKEQEVLPAFASFLHRVSVEVDLATVGEESFIDTSDEQTISGLVKLGSVVHEVVSKSAIKGRMGSVDRKGNLG